MKTERQKIVKKLDKIVSEIVRKRDKVCVQCGGDYRLGAGHVFSRVHYATRWDVSEKGNVFCQCWKCNFRHVRDQYPYFKWYMDKFGVNQFKLLRRKHNEVTKLSTPQLEKIYEKLKAHRDALPDK